MTHASTGERHGYEVFPLTADKGIRAWGRELSDMFVNAARGLSSLMVEPGTVRREKMIPVEVKAADPESLLVAWLNELLYLHEARGFVMADCAIQTLTDTDLTAEMWGEPVDRMRHPMLGHVKAVTYHLLRIRPTPQGWEGQVVVDV
jgi:SHS2 domain-containing protein